MVHEENAVLRLAPSGKTDIVNRGGLARGITAQYMIVDGQTMVWGTAGESGIKKFIYRKKVSTQGGLYTQTASGT